MRRGAALACLTLLALVFGACGSDDRPPPPRPTFRPLPEAPTTPPPRRHDEFRRPAPDLRDRPGGPAHPSPLRLTETRELPQMAQEARRDLSAELRAALGDPAGCIPPGASDLPTQGTLSVDVHVSVTGIVTRATARAPGFPAEMASCLKTRAEHVHLRGPIPNAPRAVSARLEIRAVAHSPTPEP